MNVKLTLILLALFLFASPIFAQESARPAPLLTNAFSMAIASAGCGSRFGGGHGAESRRGCGHPLRADSWTCADRVVGAVHARHHFRGLANQSLTVAARSVWAATVSA